MPVLSTSQVADTAMRLDDACARFGRSYVRWALTDGRWQRPHPRVVVLHNGPLERAELALVAWLAAPRGSVLGYGTAASLGGFSGFEPGAVHLVLRQGQRAPSGLDGVVSHWSTEMTPVDVLAHAWPARTRIARSLVDLASVQRAERMARAVVLAGVQQRLVRAEALPAALRRRGHCRHHALIIESVIDAQGGIDSVPEADFTQIVRSRGLPPPSRQVVVRGRNGRYHLDAEWEEFLVGAEVHGSHHREGRQWDLDLMRHNDVTATGRRMLHFSSFSVRRSKPEVGDLLERTLVSAGLRR